MKGSLKEKKKLGKIVLYLLVASAIDNMILVK
jgi:hypothetical protein